MEKIIHTCLKIGNKEIVNELVNAGWVCCPWCGKSYSIPDKKNMFIIVIHKWWTHGMSWDKEIVFVKSLSEAEKEADLIKLKNKSLFCDVSTYVIPMSAILDNYSGSN